MTNEQKMVISSLRAEGMGYGSIARRIGISENTVKSFCRRSTQQSEPVQQNTAEHKCLCCGVPVKQNPGCKEKKCFFYQWL